MRNLLILAIALFTFGTSVFAQTGLGGKRWQLVEVAGEKPKSPRAYIEFNEADMKISGHGGCNRLFGGYSNADGAFKIDGVGSTKMMCARPGSMETEAAFIKALGDAVKLEVNENTLILIGTDGTAVARFTAEAKKPVVPTELTARKWTLQTIGSEPIKLEKKIPFVVFDGKSGSVSGNGGCNGYGGKFESKDSKLKITNVMSTMMACMEDGRMMTEHGLHEGLRNADRYEIKGEKLYLYQGEKELLSFIGSAK